MEVVFDSFFTTFRFFYKEKAAEQKSPQKNSKKKFIFFEKTIAFFIKVYYNNIKVGESGAM